MLATHCNNTIIYKFIHHEGSTLGYIRSLRQTFLGAPHSHKECQSYSYLSHLGTQATELTEAKESAYCHVRFSSHSDSGIT